MCIVTEHAKALKRLKELEAEQKTIRPPESTKRITSGEIRDVLYQKFHLAPGKVFLSDKKYLLCDILDIHYFLERDKTNKVNYVPEAMDCDDFSYRLMGQLSIPGWSDLAFGIVWTDIHALNCFIKDNGKFYFIEPQTDVITEDITAGMGTKIRVIMM